MMLQEFDAAIPARRFWPDAAPPRSAASLAARLALSDRMGWRDGRLAQRGFDDDPFCPVYGEAFLGAAPPALVVEGLARIDAALPSPEVAMAALSAHDLVIGTDPAVSRIPFAPHEAAAALCLLACRVALSCRSLVATPAFLERAVELARLEDSSLLAASVGGPRAMRLAEAMAGDPDTFARLHTDEGLVDEVEVV